MAEHEPSGEQHSVGSAAPGPRLSALVWWRFGVAGAAPVVMALLTLWGWREAQKGCMSGLALLAALLVDAVLLPSFVIPSLVIARGLRRRPRPAVRLALLHDLVIVIVSVLVVISLLRQPWGWEPLGLLRDSAPWVGLGLVFGAEGGYLLRAVVRWRPAWPAYGLLAAGLVAAVTVIPRVVHAQRARHVRPLLAYMNAHWVKVPPSARLRLGGRSTGPGTHTDYISVQGQDTFWHVSAEHGRDGRWAFPVPHKIDFPTFSGGPYPGTSGRVSSFDQAKALLLRCGVADPGLRPKRVITGSVAEYELWSPLGQGYYRVTQAVYIRFFLQHPLTVPSRPPGTA